jgi:cytochrome c551/c552
VNADVGGPVEKDGPNRPQRKKLGRWLGSLIVALCIAFLAIQLVPVDRSNPPVESDLGAPNEVNSILRRACYDCHSNETVWPWYSRVAPVSWALAYDVKKGRAALNYSTWGGLSSQQQAKAVQESWEEVADGEMPSWYYVPLHPQARLSPNDKTTLRQWAQSAGGTRGTDEHGD